MSPPSDVTADVSEAMDEGGKAVRDAASKLPEKTSLTSEQIGLITAAIVAFVGVALLGPALARIVRPKPLSRKAEDAARDLRRRTQEATGRARDAGKKAGRRVRKQAKRLGDRAGWR